MSTPKPSPITEQQICSWFWQLSSMHGALLAQRIDSSERQRRGGLLLPFGPELVMTTARRTEHRPALFPDAPATGKVLRDRQRTALAWLTLRNRFRDMARLADDAYLVAQTQVTGPTWSFVSKALAQQHPPQLALDDIPSRNLALIPAFLVLHTYQQAKLAVQARNKAIGTQGPPRPSRSERRMKAEAERRAHHRNDAERIFAEILRSRARRE